MTERVKSGLWSLVLEICCWTMLHRQVGLLKLIAIKLRHWKRSAFYHMGDSWHIQNVQNNKIIGENEKCVFYFMEKTIQIFWPTQYIQSLWETVGQCMWPNLHTYVYTGLQSFYSWVHTLHVPICTYVDVPISQLEMCPYAQLKNMFRNFHSLHIQSKWRHR